MIVKVLSVRHAFWVHLKKYFLSWESVGEEIKSKNYKIFFIYIFYKHEKMFVFLNLILGIKNQANYYRK